MSLDLNPSRGITQHQTPYPFITSLNKSTSLTGKIVLITGASRGIGRATALAFAAAGASVAVLARTAPDLETLASEITSKYGTPILTITGDVLSSPGPIIQSVISKFGKLDILINNAGIYRMSRFSTDPDISAYWKVFEVNIKAPLVLLHAALPFFAKNEGGKGIVITVGSAAADLPLPFQSSYDASKAAVQKAVQILDMELREQGVLNFLIQPGAMVTDLGRDAVVGTEFQEMLGGWAKYMTDDIELPAQSMVALAVLAGNEKGKGVDERIKVLSGRYWDVKDDLEQILEKTEEIAERDLYHLRIRKL
ncbi:NAD(P)-binding protein [Stipitochalara longipes BDJ]|nr:NAD(P)-binding protein [Stipitochalara longipes BDJ]